MMERNHRRPPDVEEALSSMLWTPYERTTPSDSSSDDEDEKLNTKLRKSRSSYDYYYPAAAASAIAAVAGLGLSSSQSHSINNNTSPYVPSTNDKNSGCPNPNNNTKIDRFDNFRFSYPFYGRPVTGLQQKCARTLDSSFDTTELPSYESLYCKSAVPMLSNLSAACNWRSPRRIARASLESADHDTEMSNGQCHGMVRSFTDNFVNVSQPTQPNPTAIGTKCMNSKTTAKSDHRFSSNFVEHTGSSSSSSVSDEANTIDPNLQCDGVGDKIGLRNTNAIDSNIRSEVSKPEHDRTSTITNEHVGRPTAVGSIGRESVEVQTESVCNDSIPRDVAANEQTAQSHTGHTVKLSDLFEISYSFPSTVSSGPNESMAMRLNIPAKDVTSTSSVFLTNAIVQPSVTIKVNEIPISTVSNNNNGISVVNCNYSNSSSINNNHINQIRSGSVPNVESYVNNLSCHVYDDNDSDNNNQTSDDVNIVQKSTTTIVPARSSHHCVNINGLTSSSMSTPISSPERTFTSTECQTDDLPASRDDPVPTRDQRRRERRERRQQAQQQLQQTRNRHAHLLQPSALPSQPPPHPHRPTIPDILHTNYPPPYSALPLTSPPPPTTSVITPIISTVPVPIVPAPAAISDGRFTIPLPIIRRSPSERSGKGCCGQWFAGPPLRALIAVVALGGVACALGGAALGATGLAGPPSSHLTAALLMIGVGVILVTVSGAAWRMTAPGGPPCLGLGSSVDLARCGRRPCSRGGGAPHGLLYPEFQHRPPPPSYQASMQEYRLRLLLLDRDRQNGVVRGTSPPPTYRSHAGSLLRTPLTTTGRSGPGSEYSLPPSYRSRNTNPLNLTTSNDPTSDDLDADSNIALSAPSAQTRADIEIESASCSAKETQYQRAQPQVATHSQHTRKQIINLNEKLNPRALVSSSTSENSNISNNASNKDLVTIVTISSSPAYNTSGANIANSVPTSGIEILAHL